MATSQVLTSCEPIFSAVRNSKLNFNLQETPFSFYLSIRKSFTKNQTPEVQSSNSVALLAKSELERDFESVKVENKALKAQHEQTSTELKISKSKNIDMEKEIKTLSVAMKKVQKEAKEESFKHEKIVYTHVQKIQELQEFKIKKSSEEKDVKKK